MRTVLITGASGFLGSLITSRFASEGWKVLAFGRYGPRAKPEAAEYEMTACNLPDELLEDAVRRERPDVCVHCAGNANPRLSMTDPLHDYENGPQLTAWLLDAFRRHSNNTRFVFLSSAAVYGNPKTLPISEKSVVEPLSPYGFNKFHCESLLSSYRNIYGLSTSSVRIFSAYGPGLRRQVIWDLLTKVVSRKVIEVSGTGDESRDFVYGEDAAQAIYRIATLQLEPAPVYNLASGQETSIKTALELICETTGRNPEIKFDGRNAPGMPLNWRADIDLISKTGWRAETSLRAGITKIYEFAKNRLES
ncbi:NAD-dependent epimerase/dehydratase family protein [Rhodopirellula baltica]|uniref:UDP-glucose 4-epimerase n=1 Tax=Rhodopirellula baltica (strain DSM 10527 / NCIMB 13988 / SH1) TaxID=243090 RepID=Q7UVQ0_RHOBA|nr:SDR family oxidoreductase [Rhodopirellula baltica]CAD72672.1 UDP-glucose 4-epimerase [Rhodopirellula baltica SH 1]